MTFMKIKSTPEVLGDAAPEKYKNWIEVLGFDFGINNAQNNTPNTRQSRVTSGPQMSPFRIWKKVDRSTPMLFVAAAGGVHYEQVEIVVPVSDTDLSVLMSVTAKDVMISDQHVELDPRTGVLTDLIELRYAEIEISVPTLDNAPVRGAHNARTRK